MSFDQKYLPNLFALIAKNFYGNVDFQIVSELECDEILFVEDGNHGEYRPLPHEFVDVGVPFVRPPNLINGQIDLSQCQKINHEAFMRIRKGIGKGGDIVLTHNATIGRVAITKETESIFVTNPQTTVWRSKNKEVVNAKYLYYFMCSSGFQEQLERHKGRNATFDYVSLTKQRSLVIPVLNIELQNYIADALSILDDRITLLRETNATLEAITQALFKSWFVDFDPVRAQQQGREPEGMDEVTTALFPDDFEESELGLVPKGWQVGWLGDWLSVLETGRRPKGGVSGINSGVPSIGAESIVRVGEFDFAKTKYVSDDFFHKMKSGRLESRDVLLYKDGGKPGVFLPRVSMFGDGFPYEVCGINEHVFRIRLKEPFGQTFLYFWLWSDAIMHELKHRGGKAAIPGINQADVKEQRLLIPNEVVLRKFEELSSPLISRIFSNAKQIQTLANLRDTLLPRLISGQLRLPEVESELANLETNQ